MFALVNRRQIVNGIFTTVNHAMITDDEIAMSVSQALVERLRIKQAPSRMNACLYSCVPASVYENRQEHGAAGTMQLAHTSVVRRRCPSVHADYSWLKGTKSQPTTSTWSAFRQLQTCISVTMLLLLMMQAEKKQQLNFDFNGIMQSKSVLLKTCAITANNNQVTQYGMKCMLSMQRMYLQCMEPTRETVRRRIIQTDHVGHGSPKILVSGPRYKLPHQ